MTYKPIFENAVYAKDKSIEINNEQVLLKELVLVKRYTEATEDQVVEYLKQKAGKLEAAATLVVPDTARPNRSPLEIAIMKLPDKVISDLKTGDENCIDFIRQNTEAVNDDPRNHYLHVRYGLMPAKLIETNQEAGNVESAEWYDVAFSDDGLNSAGLGEGFNMQILLYEGVLPDRDEMNVLLKHGVHGSKTLEINKVRYTQDDVKDVMDLIYGRFSTPEQIVQLADISESLLEKLALQPVIGLHKMVQKNMAAQEFMSRINREGITK